MKVTLTYASAPRTVHELELTVPAGSTVAAALEEERRDDRFAPLDGGSTAIRFAALGAPRTPDLFASVFGPR